MRPSQVYDTLEDLRKRFSGSLSREGIELSLNDTQTVLDAYQQWLCLAYDLEYLRPDTLRRDARRLFTDMVKVDVLTLCNAMAECYALLQHASDNGFKARCSIISSHLPKLLDKDLTKMKEGDLYSLKRLIQLFSYLTRLSLVEIDLSQQCVESYLESERLIPDKYPEQLVSSLNKIIREWFGPYVPYEIVPNHGPGGVAGFGRTSLLQKYLDLKTDAMLRYSCGHDNWWCFEPTPSNLERVSQIKFVAKSYKTFRTISMEPATLMYFQQGVMEVIYKYVDHDLYLRGHIGFREQNRNRLLAQRGSLSRQYATLDLSAASDSVGYELVKKLFKGTWLLRYLVTLRSTHTRLPDGSLLAMRKYAPMGSSLCFPVETIVFAAVCEQITRGHRFFADYSVYGDDIIVPTACADATIRALSNLGFRVNLSKSFYTEKCPYRESCGREYFDGFDVTPMRISRKYNAKECDDRFTALIDLANSAYDKNLYALRHFFLRKMRNEGIKPYFDPTSLRADNYTNYHLDKRLNISYQRFEVRASSLKEKRISSPHIHDDNLQLREQIRYLHWLQSTYQRKILREAFVSDVDRTTVYLSYRWFETFDDVLGKHHQDDNQIFSFLD